MKQKISEIKENCESGLRKACGKITPGKRMIIIISMCLLFAVIDIIIVARAVYTLGQKDARKEIQIDHIAPPQLPAPSNSPLENPLSDEQSQ